MPARLWSGTIIGSGIFLVPAEMMQAAGSAKLVYLAWLVGGLLSFFGALTYAELGAMKPQAGGEYVYIRDGYGPLAGFLYAWTWFLIAKPASIATLATGFVRVLGNFPALSFFAHNFISAPFPVTYGQLVAVAAATLISDPQLHRDQEGGRLSAGVHLSESRHHSQHRGDRLQLQRRKLAELCRQFYRRQGRDGRIHGCAGGCVVGLRRLE